jgi:pyridoxine/pyridoxamine 5'-phosphate oxidase
MPTPKESPHASIQNKRKAPIADRPRMPKDYQIKSGRAGQLPWTWAVERLVTARNYWIATTRTDGRPHVMPVWGMWTNEEIVFATDSRSRKARNLAINPHVTVHLESGDEAIILEGRARKVEDAATLQALHLAYQAKYGTGLIGIPGNPVVLAVKPLVGFGWQERNFPESATRWVFP